MRYCIQLRQKRTRANKSLKSYLFKHYDSSILRLRYCVVANSMGPINRIIESVFLALNQTHFKLQQHISKE